jgi:hypothetical protein
MVCWGLVRVNLCLQYGILSLRFSKTLEGVVTQEMLKTGRLLGAAGR